MALVAGAFIGALLTAGARYSNQTADTFEASKAVVMRAYSDWGSGRMSGAGRDAVLAADFTANCVTDASAAMTNTDGYKVYSGLTELGEWIDFLAGVQMPDFQLLKLSPGAGPNKVMAIVSYTPTVTATGKTGVLMSDMQEWTISGGKIAAVKFFWGNPAAVDALFATGPTFAESKAAVMRAFSDWGAGRMSGEGRDAVIAADFTADCVFDNSAAMTNTNAFKVYSGHAGVKAWIDFSAGIAMPDFQLVSISPGASPDKVLVVISYTPTVTATGKTGPLMRDMQEWTIVDGKVAGGKSYLGNAAAFDTLFA